MKELEDIKRAIVARAAGLLSSKLNVLPKVESATPSMSQAKTAIAIKMAIAEILDQYTMEPERVGKPAYVLDMAFSGDVHGCDWPDPLGRAEEILENPDAWAERSDYGRDAHERIWYVAGAQLAAPHLRPLVARYREIFPKEKPTEEAADPQGVPVTTDN